MVREEPLEKLPNVKTDEAILWLYNKHKELIDSSDLMPMPMRAFAKFIKEEVNHIQAEKMM